NYHLFGFRRAHLETQLMELGFDIIETHHLPPPASPKNNEIDPVTGDAFWGEDKNQISILCVKKTI
ncbi:MAG: hypothetical protein O3B74_08115, partial [Proteobacteria bacterium]|nr:hypothetical protein [Pseudomonadota bacterium]